MTILVVGATGQVGGAVVRELDDVVPFRAMVRSPEQGDDLRGYDCEVVVGDLTKPETLDDALVGVTAAFLVTPASPQQPELEAAFADAAARAAERPHIVKLGAIGWQQGEISLARWHRASVERLVANGVPHTVIAPNGFLQNLIGSARGIGAGVLAQSEGDAAVSWVDARDVAAVAAHVLRNPDGHDGASYDVTGPEALTWSQVAERLGAALGHEVRYRPVAAAEMRQAMLTGGVPEYLADALAELAEVYRSGAGAAVTDEVTKATGRPARSIDDFVRDHAAAFRTV